MTRDVDAIVIGSGQGGVPLAVALADEGKDVVLFERGAFGGTCINVGCTPSKAFLASAHTAGRARRGHAIGVRGEVWIDFPVVMERVRSIISTWSAGVLARLDKAGVEIVRAEASFAAKRTVEGGGVSVRAPIVVIDTGGSAVVPTVDGLSDVPYLDNTTFFSQTTLPRSFIVLGGGYIGLELGQGMARAGSEVHVIHRNARVLDAEEPDASRALEAALHEDGVQLHLNARVGSVRNRDGKVIIALADGSEVSGDALLVATGRKPNTSALHCERAGIALDERGYIVVDEQLRTTAEGVFALGGRGASTRLHARFVGRPPAHPRHPAWRAAPAQRSRVGVLDVHRTAGRERGADARSSPRRRS